MNVCGACSFVTVPRGSEWVDVAVTRVDGGDTSAPLSARESDSPRTIVVHLVQTLAHTSLKKSSTEEYFALLPGQTSSLSFSVVPDATLEVVVAQYWSSQGETQVAAQLEFRGVHSSLPQVFRLRYFLCILPLPILRVSRGCIPLYSYCCRLLTVQRMGL
jgi:hypothetical protein